MLDFTVLDEEMDNGPGRNPTYPRSTMTKGVLYAISQGKYSYEAIAQCLKTYPARRLCGFGTETPVASTIFRFWKRIWKFLPLVFEYVTDILDACDIYGETFAIDATALPTQEDDPDAVWAFDEHSEDNFYYGYGLVTRDHKSSSELRGLNVQIGSVSRSVQNSCSPRVSCQASPSSVSISVVSIAWVRHSMLVSSLCCLRWQKTAPVGREDEVVDDLFDDVDMDETFRQRQAAEPLFSILKDDDQKLEFRKRGFERVATQVYLVLIDRLLTALAKWTRNPDANLLRSDENELHNWVFNSNKRPSSRDV